MYNENEILEWKKLANENTGDSTVYLKLADYHLSKGKIILATEMFKRAFALDKNNVCAINNFGVLLYNQNNLEAAQAQFEIASDIEGNTSYIPLYNYIAVSVKLNCLSDAKNYAERIEKMFDGGNETDLIKTVEAYYASSYFENVIKSIKTLLTKTEITPEIFAMYDYATYKTEGKESSERLFESIICEKKDYAVYIKTGSKIDVFKQKTIIENIRIDTEKIVSFHEDVLNDKPFVLNSEPIFMSIE